MKKMDCFKKFDVCKFNRDDFWCTKLNHNVGVNGYSIRCHCTNCTKWAKR